MKYLIWILFIASIGCICFGYFGTEENSDKFIGIGVAILFFLVFPLFSYYKWKDKNLKDYMITQENLEKMREYREKEKRK